MIMNRRGILLGLASALAAPAIVHAGNLMPVKAWNEGQVIWSVMLNSRSHYRWIAPPGGELMLSLIPAEERIFDFHRPSWDNTDDRFTETKIIRKPDGTLRVDTEGQWQAFSLQAAYEGIGPTDINKARKIPYSVL